MARPTVQQSPDWLRPTRRLVRDARPDLCPNVTNPEQRELLWNTLLAMAVGGLFGLAIVLGLPA